MVGVSSSHNSGLSNPPNVVNASTSTSSPGLKGREQAIEVLIDSDPSGSFYRAARVVEDAVPLALSSRPNVVTKNSLIEQAFALGVYEIDSIEKYDEAYSPGNNVKLFSRFGVSSSSEVSLVVDSLTKERIFNYQAKLLTEKQKKFPSLMNIPKSTNVGINQKPSIQGGLVGGTSGLISALRNVFEEPHRSASTDPPSLSVASFELRQLLQSVSSHPLLVLAGNSANNLGWTDEFGNTSSRQKCKLQLKLEQYLLQLSKFSDKDKDEYVQGLMIIILLLVTCDNQASSLKGVDDTRKTDADDKHLPPYFTQQRSDLEDLDVLQLELQVGALLYLMPIGTTQKDLVRNESEIATPLNAAKDYSFHLDQSLLSYFGESASIFEERLEIQKARMLARIQTPDSSNASIIRIAPPNPVSLPSTSVKDSDSHAVGCPNNVQTARIEAEKKDQSDHGDSTIPEALEQGSHNAQSEHDMARTNNDVGNNVSDDDDESSDNSAEESGDDVIRTGAERRNGGSVELDMNPEQSDDDDLVAHEDSSSSSSSSESSAGSEQGIDSDDEDEAVLRHALAMSMADQEEAAAEEGRVLIPASGTVELQSGQSLPARVADIDDVIYSSENPISRPVSPQLSSGQGQDPLQSEVDDELSSGSLPPFPAFPHTAQLPSIDSIGSIIKVIPEDPDAQSTVPNAPENEFDPSLFSRFGSIPGSYALLHLVQYTRYLIEQRRFSKLSSNQRNNTPFVLSSVIRPQRSKDVDGSQNAKPMLPYNDFSESSVTLQLLVASFILIDARRNRAIDVLREALYKEMQASQTVDVIEDSFVGSEACRSSGEEDDPALNFAMNYVEDDTPLSSESLENKGMRRKAAAAAHDHAAFLTSLKKQTESCKIKVKFYSLCLVHSTVTIRVFLQGMVRQALFQPSKEASSSHLNFGNVIPNVVLSKVSTILSLLSSSIPFNAPVMFDDHGKDEIFQEISLYKESILLWGECLPLLYPSTASQVEVLISTMDQCSRIRSGEIAVKYAAVEEIASFPTSPIETSIHKLQVLCRRLRTSDLLRQIISKPLTFLDCTASATSASDLIYTLNAPNEFAERPRRAASIVRKVGQALMGLVIGRAAVRQLYLALCHRYHSTVLLFDGFFLTAETDADESPPSACSKILSSGDAIRVNNEPSPILQFDPTKCSDSIAILSSTESTSIPAANGPSVNQRASKVWGTVLSSHYYTPKTGVHRWAVRLDKCERGHVFIGVATAQASTRTYVGGDKYGWGMIGTQALWHDRRKIRGDFGSTFRTGSVIVVTLDSDAGTLSFSCWKDSSTSSTLSCDPVVQSIMTPRLYTQGGTIEDWGIAFEGLPLDARLFPAVGLYQRDDRVTLLSVDSSPPSSARGSWEMSGGLRYYPHRLPKEPHHLQVSLANQVKQFNSELTWDGIEYVSDLLQLTVERSFDDSDNFIISQVLPSLAASLCLIPTTVPILSTRFAVLLVPLISKCIMDIFVAGKQIGMGQNNRFPLDFQEGKWIFQGIGPATGSDFEEYVVDLTVCMDQCYGFGIMGKGKGTAGTSKNGQVTINGCWSGSLLTFTEEWTDGLSSSSRDSDSSCVVMARLSLDGRRFEGVYKNAKYGTTGQLVGSYLEGATNHFSSHHANNMKTKHVKLCETMLCLAQSHMLCMLGDDMSGDFNQVNDDLPENSRSILKSALLRPVLARCSLSLDNASFQSQVSFLRQMYGSPFVIDGTRIPYNEHLLDFELKNVTERRRITSRELEQVSRVDNLVAPLSGGLGSLRRLNPLEYNAARLQIICALLHNVNLVDKLSLVNASAKVPDDVVDVWRQALNILEDRVRRKLLMKNSDTTAQSCSAVCSVCNEISMFLQQVEVNDASFPAPHVVLSELAWLYQAIESRLDLDFLRTEMNLATHRGILRLRSFEALGQLLVSFNVQNANALEALCMGLPRELGRGKEPAFCVGKKHVGDESSLDAPCALDGSYLSRLSGCCSSIRNAIRSEVLNVYRMIMLLLNKAVSIRETSVEDASSTDSVILSLLTVFIGNIRDEDLSMSLFRRDAFDLLSRIFTMYRRLSNDANKAFDTKLISVSSLQQIMRRDVCLAVIKCTLAATHVLSYQLAVFAENFGSDGLDITECLSLLNRELDMSISDVEDSTSLAIKANDTQLRDKEFSHWNETITNRKIVLSSDISRDTTFPDDYCLNYVKKHGILHSLVLHGSGIQMGILKSQPVTNTSHSDYLSLALDGFDQQVLSQWLHILSSLLRCGPFHEMISCDRSYLRVLLSAVGFLVEVNEAGDILTLTPKSAGVTRHLPSRFKSRIVRLLAPVLALSKPNDKLVQGLLQLSGLSSSDATQSSDDDNAVGRELASLIRRLYSFYDNSWKPFIDHAINNVMTLSRDDSSVLYTKAGILMFLSGAVSSVDVGSYVLLKPSAAASLSPEHQPSAVGKSHPGGMNSSISYPSIGATPHHLAGNGTESIITGLCRDRASAGIVSNIDIKNGTCEVILLSRDLPMKKYSEDEVSSPFLGIGGNDRRSVSNDRHCLTVRALQTPIGGIVLAQEVPLILADSLPVEQIADCIKSSLDSLLSVLAYISENEGVISTLESKGDDPPGEYWKPFHLSIDVMVVRTGIVLLSDKELCRSFCSLPCCREIFSKILSLALPPAGAAYLSLISGLASDRKGMAALPAHESRYVYLLSMLKDLNRRITLFENIDDDEDLRRIDALRLPGSIPVKVESTQSATEALVGDEKSQKPSSQTKEISENSRENESTQGHTISQSTGGNIGEDDEENDAAATAAAHLREAAIAQMAELGLPRSWADLALRRTGGINIEAAVTFCLERGGEMERLLAEDRDRDRMMQRDNVVGTARRRGNRDNGPSNHLLRQLLEMGFPRRWCSEALAVTGNNVDEALTWILNNGERLSEEDENLDEGNAETEDVDEDESADGEDDEDEIELDNTQSSAGGGLESAPLKVDEQKQENLGWHGCITPLHFLSGRASVDPKKMEISGLPTGGFSSIGTKGVLLTSGKWYYEAVLETAGCLQIGWADGSFAGHCHADRGDGCGDGPSSWAFDGWRRYRWHATATEWGCRWKEGDVVGCLVDMDDRSVAFTLNGKGECIGMGVAFSGEGFRPCSGVYACVSFNRREKLRLILGGEQNEPFKYGPPAGYRGVGEAVLDAVTELDELLSKEHVVGFESSCCNVVESKRFLCDFSDGEHGHELMAWAHRYYGSDASVHLGSSRSKGMATKMSNALWRRVDECVDRRVCKAWSSAEDATTLDFTQVLETIICGYYDVKKTLWAELSRECIVMSILLARKLLLHIIISLGDEFDPTLLVANETDMYMLWKVIDICSSLGSAGWIGEAGAMAIAAEALGLGISSNDLSRANLERNGIISALDLDENLFLPACCFTQLLTPILRFDSFGQGTNYLAVAYAEASIGGEGAGLLTFLREGLQSACCRSKYLRSILLANIRRSVRLLAVVEYENDDFEPAGKQEDDDDEAADKSIDAHHNEHRSGAQTRETNIDSLPDARLTSFLTGLLLSSPVITVINDKDDLTEQLFQAWSVGLLSSSLPFRMVCAFTAAGILNLNKKALGSTVQTFPTLGNLYGRLQSTITRRIWAERSAMPVCSRYIQAMIELLSSVRSSVEATCEFLPVRFMRLWNVIDVDAATPLPIQKTISPALEPNWESTTGWTSSDRGWEMWSGTVEYLPVEWKTPSRSSVRTLMDGGDGPPMLREGCLVVRGIDWDEFHQDSNEKDEDGKDIYDQEKLKRDKEKQATEENDKDKIEDECAGSPDKLSLNPPEDSMPVEATTAEHSKVKKKKNKMTNPKQPLGTVLSVESWNGVPAMARRVRWHLTGKEGLYRYGGDGGRYDISHVETNAKQTRIKKRHPLPESREQCASRHGFGSRKTFPVLLRIRRDGELVSSTDTTLYRHEGVLEWPDFGAGVRVNCLLYNDGKVVIEELDLLFGSKHCGWELRFGQPSFASGTVVALSPTRPSSSNEYSADLDVKSSTLSQFKELIGRWQFDVEYLRNPENGSKIQVSSEMRLYLGRSCQHSTHSTTLVGASLPPTLTFDREYHASTLLLSKDNRTVSCSSSDGRGTAFASMGFTKGCHYWEVKLEQADIGSVFIGVAEKPAGSGSGSSFVYETPARLNRWHGWGFVNFRATYTAGAERVYGSHCHTGDTVGVLLDCDAGRLSFFFDGLKYGEHILNDLECAFENLSPFGFNVASSGSGGAGQGAPSGFESGPSGRYHPAQGTIRPRTLWPVVGLRNQGDRVTISSKWISSYGVDGVATLQNITALDSILKAYFDGEGTLVSQARFPHWFVRESYLDYVRWGHEQWQRSISRGSGPFRLTSFGLDLELDASPLACASACASLGLDYALLRGDRVRLKRSAGRILELAEEALILGAYHGRLYYRIVSQKSEGGSLTEGGGRAWCFDESEVVDGLSLISPCRQSSIRLPKISRFTCLANSGLKVVYEHGAVVRSDIEIFDFSVNLGTIPFGTVIPKEDVLERRVNSCGVVRFRVRYQSIGDGWISARIRGGTEEPIVEAVNVIEKDTSSNEYGDKVYWTPQDAASAWFDEWSKHSQPVKMADHPSFDGSFGLTLSDFESLISEFAMPGLNAMQADSLLAEAMTVIGTHSINGDALEISFVEVASALSFGLSVHCDESVAEIAGASSASKQAVASVFVSARTKVPSLRSCLARLSILRAINRRARYAMPWLSVRPCQEGSALFGGVSGHGTSVLRAGRTVSELQKSWVCISSIASRTRLLRRLFFMSTKMEILQGITDATTTPTPLSHDEYELPREIRTVRINRLKAGRAMLGEDVSFKRKYSVFAQLQSETRNFGASLRRGYVAKGHGGQRRAFKVKLIGEGVNDYSGPYREVFTDAVSEVLKFDVNGKGVLPALDPTPNNFSSVGDCRDLFMFSLNGRDLRKPAFASHHMNAIQHLRLFFASLLVQRDEVSREVEEAVVFLGRLAGTAFRHRIALDLPLPLHSVWKALTEEDSRATQKIEELDILARKQLLTESEAEFHPLLWWQQRMLSSFAEGLSNVIPVELLPLLTGSELRAAICGNNEIDIELLKQVVEYEGYDGTENVIRDFWDVLREMSNQERKQFLQFVWARNRLPMRASDFEAPFKIQKDTVNCDDKSDFALPSASTCFFSLTLPQYSSFKVLQEKLLFAINNVTTMETDFQTNNAEIAEGYR